MILANEASELTPKQVYSMDIDNTLPALDPDFTCGSIDNVNEGAEGEDANNEVDADANTDAGVQDVEQAHNELRLSVLYPIFIKVMSAVIIFFSSRHQYTNKISLLTGVLLY